MGVFLTTLVAGPNLFDDKDFFTILHPHFNRLKFLTTSSDPLYLPLICNLLATYSSLYLYSDPDTLTSLHLSILDSLSSHLTPCSVLPLIFLSLHLQSLLPLEEVVSDKVLGALDRLEVSEPQEALAVLRLYEGIMRVSKVNIPLSKLKIKITDNQEVSIKKLEMITEQAGNDTQALKELIWCAQKWPKKTLRIKAIA